jgi:transposase
MQRVTKLVYNYFCREARRDRLYHGIQYPEKRTQKVLGISSKSFSRWIRQDEEFVNNNGKHGRKTKIDSFDKDVIKRNILKMLKENEIVTLRKLNIRLQSECDIFLSKTTLWKIIRQVSFTFRKSAGGRNIVCEKPHLITARSKYLRQIRERRMQGYDIVYLDESWVNAHHTYEKEWQSCDREKRRTIPSSKGQRIILAHAGSRTNGLVNGAELVFQAKSTDGRDYHTEMNGQVFREWMENTLLPSLDRPSCIVMDNASYHNVIAPESKVPTATSNKDQIRNWLQHQNVPFLSSHLKSDLLQLVRHMKMTNVYQIDNIIAQHGHTSLRLPPYHSHLNPIELVWAHVKGQVAATNTTFKMSDVKRLTIDALSRIDIAYWIKCEEHVLREEEEYWRRDGLQCIQPLTIVNLQDSTDSE